MTPGVGTRSGPAHAKRNPEPAGGSAPCRHTTKSEGRAGSSKNIAQHATERSVSRLGPTSAARKSDRRNSRPVERPEGSDPQFRPSGKTAGTQSDRLPLPQKPPRCPARLDKPIAQDFRTAGKRTTCEHPGMRRYIRPADQRRIRRTAKRRKKAGDGDPTRNHDNGIPERRHTSSPSGKQATHDTPSQPRFGTFRSGEGNHRPGTEYLGKWRNITKIRIRNNR